MWRYSWLFPLVVSLLLTFLFSSCFNIERRLYRDGFYLHTSNVSGINFTESSIPGEISKAECDQYVLSSLTSNAAGRVESSEKQRVVRNTPFHYVPDTIPPKKGKRKNDGPKKFDEGKDVTKQERDVPVAAQMGLTFGVVSFACLGFLLGGGGLAMLAVGLVSSLLGLGFSIGGLHIIKKEESKAGKGVATAGIILNLIFPVAAIAFLIFFLYVFGN